MNIALFLQMFCFIYKETQKTTQNIILCSNHIRPVCDAVTVMIDSSF